MYKVTQIAKELNVTHRTVLNWIYAGLIDSIRLPKGHFRIPEEELERLKNGGKRIRGA